MHGTAGVSKAVTEHQSKEFGFGGTGLAAAESPIIPELGIMLELGGTYLTAGDDPDDPTLEPLGDGSGFTAGLGLRFSPFASAGRSKSASPAGLWLAGAGGVAQTGGDSRAMFDASLGFDFFFSKGRIGAGPAIGYLHIFQPDSELRPADLNLLFVGAHIVVYTGGKEAPVDDDWDKDGIKNDVDKCPKVPEDIDGWEDDDGCPEDDNDKDGILDKVDHCPNEAEDKDGFEDEDGCPDTDNDKDKILDRNDKCPDDPEDMDGFEDEDGCPEDDNDQDGVLDANDLCPEEKETPNNYADHDGCPDSEQIRVVGDKIVLDDRIYFRTNSHIIRAVSYPLLERLAKLLNDHPEYVHVEIQGHTDRRGPDWFNQKLSEDRAAAVKTFLVDKGVEAGRLSSVGFGATRPRADKKSEHAYFLNRRVEFQVTRQKKVVVRQGGPDKGDTSGEKSQDEGSKPKEKP